MMPHDSFNERLSAYLDGELAPAEREEVDVLLRQQPELAEALDQARQLGEEIRQLPAHSLGPKFADRVLAAAQQNRAGAGPAAKTTRRWLAAAFAITALAALMLAMVALRPGPDDVIQPQPPQLSTAERTVAGLLADADEGKAVILRLRLTKEEIRGKVLDQALAAHGILAAPATGVNPAARETAQAYKALAEQASQAGVAADVVFIEAEATRLQKALAAVAESRDGMLAISFSGVVASTGQGFDQITKAEGEGGSQLQEAPIDRRNYAQHLPPRGFPLLKSAPVSSPEAAPPAVNGQKPARVLVVVEVIP
jgi:hypothetical protein